VTALIRTIMKYLSLNLINCQPGSAENLKLTLKSVFKSILRKKRESKQMLPEDKLKNKVVKADLQVNQEETLEITNNQICKVK
jgi:hypothetical protein